MNKEAWKRLGKLLLMLALALPAVWILHPMEAKAADEETVGFELKYEGSDELTKSGWLDKDYQFTVEVVASVGAIDIAHKDLKQDGKFDEISIPIEFIGQKVGGIDEQNSKNRRFRVDISNGGMTTAYDESIVCVMTEDSSNYGTKYTLKITARGGEEVTIKTGSAICTIPFVVHSSVSDFYDIKLGSQTAKKYDKSAKTMKNTKFKSWDGNLELKNESLTEQVSPADTSGRCIQYAIMSTPSNDPRTGFNEAGTTYTCVIPVNVVESNTYIQGFEMVFDWSDESDLELVDAKAEIVSPSGRWKDVYVTVSEKNDYVTLSCRTDEEIKIKQRKTVANLILTFKAEKNADGSAGDFPLIVATDGVYIGKVTPKSVKTYSESGVVIDSKFESSKTQNSDGSCWIGGGTAVANLGNVNGDNTVDLLDVIIVMKMSEGIDANYYPQDMWNRADVDGNGKVDLIDAVMILKIYQDNLKKKPIQQTTT